MSLEAPQVILILAPPEKNALGSDEDLLYVFPKCYTAIKWKLSHYPNNYEKQGIHH